MNKEQIWQEFFATLSPPINTGSDDPFDRLDYGTIKIKFLTSSAAKFDDFIDQYYPDLTETESEELRIYAQEGLKTWFRNSS